jgi:lipopolysaccharide transport protein LptA
MHRPLSSLLAPSLLGAWLLGPAALVALSWVSPAQAASPKRDTLHIEVDAASTEIDFRNNTAVLHTVVIREGDIRVEADEATATGGVDNFENNQWVLTGSVRILMPGGSLQANRAVVSFVDNRLVRAVITGAPSTFEQRIEESGDLASGRAQNIEYDVVGGTVRLQGDAFLTDGRNQITGQALVYSILDQRVLATAEDQGGERVHFTINPQAAEQQKERQDPGKQPGGSAKEPSAPAQPRPTPEPPRT